LCHLLSSIANTFQCTISHAAYLFAPATAPSTTALVTTSAATGKSDAPSSGVSSVADLFNSYHQRRYASRAAAGITSTTSPSRLDAMTPSLLRGEVSVWYRTCVELVREPLTIMLTRVTHGAQLGAIRDAVLATLVTYPPVDTSATATSTEAKLPQKEKPSLTSPSTPSSKRASLEEKGDDKDNDHNTSNNDSSVQLVDEQRRVAEAKRQALIEHERARDRWNGHSHMVIGRHVQIWDDVFWLPFSSRFRDVIRMAFERLALHTLVAQAVQRIQTLNTNNTTNINNSNNNSNAQQTNANGGVVSLATAPSSSPLSGRLMPSSTSVESLGEEKKDASKSANDTSTATVTSSSSSNLLSFVLWPNVGDTNPFALLPPPSIPSVRHNNGSGAGASSTKSRVDTTPPSSSNGGSLYGLYSDHVDAICGQFNNQLSGVMADVGLLLDSTYFAPISATSTTSASPFPSSSRLLASESQMLRGGEFPALVKHVEAVHHSHYHIHCLCVLIL
jgi:hypothetical protein